MPPILFLILATDGNMHLCWASYGTPKVLELNKLRQGDQEFCASPSYRKTISENNRCKHTPSLSAETHLMLMQCVAVAEAEAAIWIRAGKQVAPVGCSLQTDGEKQ